MKTLVIKVIKRKAVVDIARVRTARRSRKRGPTVTTTVNDWIAESRRNRLDGDSSSRKTIADWTAEATT